MTQDEVVSSVGKWLTGMGAAALVKLGIMILGGVVLSHFLMKVVDRVLARTPSLRRVERYVRMAARAVFWFLLALIIAGSFGIQVTSLIALFSVFGLTVSLALQNTLENLAGGIVIFLVKPFEVGHYISVDGAEGTVSSIGVSYTCLTTADNRETFVPNSQIASAKITNFTRLGKRRITAVFAAPYETPTETVLAALKEAVAAVPQVLGEPEPMVHLSEYGENKILYEVRVWCASGDYWTVYFALREAVRPAYEKNGIQMPYGVYLRRGE